MIDCTGAAAQQKSRHRAQRQADRKVGTKDSIKIPQGIEVLDCGSCTLIPGMMDIHIHTMMFNCLTFHNHRVAQWEITPRAAADVRRCFTRSTASTWASRRCAIWACNSQRGLLVAEACAIRDAIDAGILEGPRMLVARFHDDYRLASRRLSSRAPRYGSASRPPTGRGSCASSRARISWRGCDVIKTCASGGGGTDKEEPDIRNMTQEELDAVVDEAHAFHKICAVHCFTPQASAWR